MPEPIKLMSYGEPSSQLAFGRSLSDLSQNGKAPGGIALDTTNPTGDQTQVAGRVDPRSLVSLKTSPTSWVLLGVVVFVWLNAKARRAGAKG
jgi:hypothetical protein